MGANYDMMIIRAASQENVIESLSLFLQTRGLTAVSVASVGESHPARWQTDNVVFVGPGRLAPWIPLACVAANMRISCDQWFATNPLATFISKCLAPVIFLWSLDSGWASGYSVYERGEITERQVAFSPSAGNKEFLYPGIPTPRMILGDRLKTFLSDPQFDYEQYSSSFGALEKATGCLASRFGLDVHLIDASSAAEGESCVTIRDGSYQAVDLVDWAALYYEPIQLSMP